MAYRCHAEQVSASGTTQGPLDREKGIFKIPTRVYLRDEFVFCDSAETGGPASLRLDQLAGILAGMGLLAREAGIWALGPRGDLLA